VVNGADCKELYSKFKTKHFPDPTQLAEAVVAYLKNGTASTTFALLYPVSDRANNSQET
jgi:hypothetical protein